MSVSGHTFDWRRDVPPDEKLGAVRRGLGGESLTQLALLSACLESNHSVRGTTNTWKAARR